MRKNYFAKVARYMKNVYIDLVARYTVMSIRGTDSFRSSFIFTHVISVGRLW